MSREFFSPNLTSRREASNKPLWLTWFLALTAVAVVQLSTIGIAPFLHKDEFLIVDLGRIILAPKTDWAIAWMADQDKPLHFLSYLGPVLQELSYQVVGEYGPRVSSLIGAFAAATVTVKWLLSKGTSRAVAFVLGLTFLLDPIFVQSYASGRVDSWMIAACLSSCWILAKLNADRVATFPPGLKVAMAGALTAIALFIWPTAVFLAPIVILELLTVKTNLAFKPWKKTAINCLCFALGCALIALLLLIPVFSLAFSNLYNLHGMQTNVGVGLTKSGSQLLYYSLDQFIGIFRVLKFSPILFVVACLYGIQKKQTGLIVAISVVAIGMVLTKTYLHRVQYLLPYLIALVAGGHQMKYSNQQAYNQTIRKAALTALLVWPIVLSLGIRFILASDRPEERKREVIYKAAERMVGPGNYGVYSTFEFYYPGRSLGWKMYVGYDEVLSVTSLKKILRHLDYAILPQNEIDEEMALLLRKQGMRDRGTYYVYDSPRETGNEKGTNIGRLRNLFSIFRKPYGPYRLYAKDSPSLSFKATRH